MLNIGPGHEVGMVIVSVFEKNPQIYFSKPDKYPTDLFSFRKTLSLNCWATFLCSVQDLEDFFQSSLNLGLQVVVPQRYRNTFH